MTFSVLLCVLFSSQLLAQDLSDNDLLRSSRRVEAAQAVFEDHLSRSFLPKVNVTLGEEYFGVDSIEPKAEPFGILEAKLNLYNGGMDQLTSEIARLKTGLSRWQTQTEEREELKKVRQLQIELIFNNEMITLLERELEENKRLRTQAGRRAASGVATSTDVLEFDINASELEEMRESLAHENLILKLKLQPLLGLKASELQIPKKLEHHHDDRLLKRVETFKTHPRVSLYRMQSELSQRERSMSRRYQLPSLELFAAHYNNFELPNRDFRERNRLNAQGVGLRLLVNLYDGHESSLKATSLAHAAEANNYRAQYEEKILESEFNALKEELIHTHEIMHTILERVTKSREYLQLTLKEYDRGVKNSLDALTAMQRMYRYEKDYMEKKRDYENFKAELLAVLGE